MAKSRCLALTTTEMEVSAASEARLEIATSRACEDGRVRQLDLGDHFCGHRRGFAARSETHWEWGLPIL